MKLALRPLARRYPRGFGFYLADPISSVHGFAPIEASWMKIRENSKGFLDAPSVSQQEVTRLLTRWSQGDDGALAELTPLVYEELRRLAH